MPFSTDYNVHESDHLIQKLCECLEKGGIKRSDKDFGLTKNGR